MHSLGSTEAFEEGLVKQIIVHNIKEDNSNVSYYIKVLKIDNKKNSLIAKLELFNENNNLKTFTFKQSDSLDNKSKNNKYATKVNQ